MFGSHEAAEAHAIIALERLAKNIGILLQAADRIRGSGQHRLEISRCVLPIAPRYRCAEIGLAREMMVDARGLDAHFVREIAEIQAAVAMRLCGPSGGRQDGFLRA